MGSRPTVTLAVLMANKSYELSFSCAQSRTFSTLKDIIIATNAPTNKHLSYVFLSTQNTKVKGKYNTLHALL